MAAPLNSPRPVTPDEDAQIVELFNAGTAINQIGRKLDRQPQVVIYRLQKLGLRTVGEKKINFVTAAEEQAWLKEFLQGKNAKQIGTTRVEPIVWKHLALKLRELYLEKLIEVETVWAKPTKANATKVAKVFASFKS
jgi:hypothetical protein